MHGLIVYSRVSLIHQNDTKQFPEKQEIHSIYSLLTDARHLLAHYVSIKLHATWISLPFEVMNKDLEQITRDISLIILHDSRSISILHILYFTFTMVAPLNQLSN